MTNKDPELLPCQVSDAESEAVQKCQKGSCHRHGRCMYLKHPQCPLTYTASTIPTDGELRDIAGETVCGFRVAAYRETHPEHGDKYGHSYSEHWSTPSNSDPRVKVERLFTEDQLRAALSIQTISGKGMREAAIAVGSALDDWIKLIGVDGQWTRPPMHDEAQEAMRANNVLAALVDQGERG